MTEDSFRKLALGQPFAGESSHMNHPDFRIRNKVFASLVPAPAARGADGALGMVKLTPAQQREFMAQAPDAFFPCSGAWGAGGATHVRLAHAERATVKLALAAAWRNVAPPALVRELDSGKPAPIAGHTSRRKQSGSK